MRAADLGYTPRLQAFSVASGFVPLPGIAQPTPSR
jgi:hypothetical protein